MSEAAAAAFYEQDAAFAIYTNIPSVSETVHMQKKLVSNYL